MISPDEISHSCLMISMLFDEPEAPLLILFTKQHYVSSSSPPPAETKRFLFLLQGHALIRAKIPDEVEAFVLGVEGACCATLE